MLDVNIHKIVCFILYFFSSSFYSVFFTSCLNKRFQKFTSVGYYLLYMAVFLLPTTIKFWLTDFKILFLISYYAILIMVILYLFIFFKDVWWKKICCFFSLLIICTVVETFVLSMASFMGLKYLTSFTNVDTLIVLVLVYLLLFPLSIIYIIFWNKFMNHVRAGCHNMWIFSVFLISQGLIYSGISYSLRLYQVKFNYLMVYGGTIMSIIADLGLFFVIMEQNERKKSLEKLATIEKYCMIEHEKYNNLMKKQENIRKLRHDMKNQINTLTYLIEFGELSKAEMMIKQIKEGLL